jgi:hypothetical protein
LKQFEDLKGEIASNHQQSRRGCAKNLEGIPMRLSSQSSEILPIALLGSYGTVETFLSYGGIAALGCAAIAIISIVIEIRVEYWGWKPVRISFGLEPWLKGF